MASDNELSSNFLEEPRSMCSHMLRDLAGDHRCSLHPEQTKYIRAITKPKLLQWISPGNAGTYKLVNLSGRQFMDVIRPITMHMPLEQLIVALYFGATWSSRKYVTTTQLRMIFILKTPLRLTIFLPLSLQTGSLQTSWCSDPETSS